MKVTINIELDGTVDTGDQELIDRLIEAGAVTSPTVTVGASLTPAGDPAPEDSGTDSAPSDPPPSADPVVDEVAAKRSAAAKKAAATKAKNKAKKAAEAGGDPEAPKASQGALNKAMAAAVKDKGLPAIKDIVKTFTGKNGEPCVRMGDIKESDFAAVIEALK